MFLLSQEIVRKYHGEIGENTRTYNFSRRTREAEGGHQGEEAPAGHAGRGHVLRLGRIPHRQVCLLCLITPPLSLQIPLDLKTYTTYIIFLVLIQSHHHHGNQSGAVFCHPTGGRIITRGICTTTATSMMMRE